MLTRAPGFTSIKCNFCFRFFATWTNQQHYKTSPYDMGCRFGGSVGMGYFWWKILDTNYIHSFHLCMILGNQEESWPMYQVLPISERFMLGWFGGTWPACYHWASSTGLTAVRKFKPRLPAQWAVGTHRKCPSRMEKVTSRMNWPIRNSTQIRN